MELAEQIAELQRQRDRDIARERVVQDASFLHSDRFALNERIGAYEAAPLTLFHCNLLRMMGSPFMPPFETPGPDELAAFLWVVNPKFIPGNGREAERRRNRFLKTCRVFVKPAEPIFGLTYRVKRWQARAGEALSIFTQTVAAAREYMSEALQDRPEASAAGGELSYYSDFCHIAANLMRNYPGMEYRQIQFLPVKVVYQFLKEIREHAAVEAGQPPILWGKGDEANDKILELLNTRQGSSRTAASGVN